VFGIGVSYSRTENIQDEGTFGSTMSISEFVAEDKSTFLGTGIYAT
jgi:hypothetical protein